MVFFRCIVLILVYLPFTLSSQSLGSVTGKVIYRYQQYPLEFVNVQVDGTAKGGATDSLAYFLIDNIPVCTYNLLFSSLGYKTFTLFNVVITSGNQSNFSIELE